MPTHHEGFLRHKGHRYFKLALLLSIVAMAVYIFADVGARPNGGTWYGYTLGTISALLIFWLMLLGVRKRAITPGKWSLKGWTSAHVYLGASLLVLATLHTGFQFGWNVHTLAYVLMLAVIGSGFFGIYYYATVPRLMSDNRAQTSQAEMLEEIDSLNRELQDAAQPLDQVYAKEVERAIHKTKLQRGLIGRISGEDRSCPTARAIRKLKGAAATAPEEMRRPLSEILSILERKDAALVRTRRHIKYRSLLELWLYFHVPLSFALLAALLAHIVSVFFYW
jgi:hypothetical protein